jgi:hypothetical protein
MANVALLKATLRYIELHPEEWEQSLWICETTACFAGTACLLMGGKRIFRKGELSDDESVRVGRKRRLVMEMAQEVLDLNSNDASWLFNATNSLSELRRMVNELIAKELAS